MNFRVLARVVAVALTVAVVLLGVWITGGVLTDDFKSSAALMTVFFALAGAAALLLFRTRRRLGLPVLVTFLIASSAVGGYLAYTTFADKTVNEALASGEMLGTGSFRSHAHDTTGSAQLVRVGGELKLQLVDLETSAGPDLRVYLVPGGYEGGDADDNVDLGGLKGNRGTQEYDVPAGVDTGRYSTVVIWCRAFSVAFGSAELT